MIINPKVSSWSDGIITYINSEHSDDLYNYIKIYPNSTSNQGTREGANALINISYQNLPNVDFKRKDWCSENIPNSYFILYFPHFYISPSYYAFQSRNQSDQYYPKSWYVQGSLNQINWINISEKVSNAMDKNEQQIISLDKQGIFKYFKFIQIEAVNENYFCLQKIELYGRILYNLETLQKHTNNLNINSCLFLIIIC